MSSTFFDGDEHWRRAGYPSDAEIDALLAYDPLEEEFRQLEREVAARECVRQGHQWQSYFDPNMAKYSTASFGSFVRCVRCGIDR